MGVGVQQWRSAIGLHASCLCPVLDVAVVKMPPRIILQQLLLLCVSWRHLISVIHGSVASLCCLLLTNMLLFTGDFHMIGKEFVLLS